MDTRHYILFGILDQLLHQAERPSTAALLARRLDVSALEVSDALLHLEGKGLLRADTMRLTLSGLAAAQALAGARRSRRTQAA
ncbi:MAG: hypothetical protein AAF411_30700 [Myxococcota bacterium]